MRWPLSKGLAESDVLNKGNVVFKLFFIGGAT
jgi:hypothetical protein